MKTLKVFILCAALCVLLAGATAAHAQEAAEASEQEQQGLTTERAQAISSILSSLRPGTYTYGCVVGVFVCFFVCFFLGGVDCVGRFGFT
jgi:hypothetical protein